MSNRYRTYQASGVYGLDQAIKVLGENERIVKIVTEVGFTVPGTQYTQPYKNPDIFLLITEVEDTDGKF